MVSKTVFLLGAGFTKAALPQAPLNADLATVVAAGQSASRLPTYMRQYRTSDIEVLLTRLDLDASQAKLSRRALDREAINVELANYFRSFRFNPSELSASPWLCTFATEIVKQDDAVVTLNYDCFLEGLLDWCGVWAPGGGYACVDNPLIDAVAQNSKGITLYKIHGSEHFRISPVFPDKGQDDIAFEFNAGVFPKSAAASNFGGGVDSRPYLIAPSFVKLPHRQMAQMMVRLVAVTQAATNLVIVGCGLRKEDSFLWVMLIAFLNRREHKNLIIVDPYAATIEDRIARFWIGDLCKYTSVSLLPCGLATAVPALNRLLT